VKLTEKAGIKHYLTISLDQVLIVFGLSFLNRFGAFWLIGSFLKIKFENSHHIHFWAYC